MFAFIAHNTVTEVPSYKLPFKATLKCYSYVHSLTSYNRYVAVQPPHMEKEKQMEKEKDKEQ